MSNMGDGDLFDPTDDTDEAELAPPETVNAAPVDNHIDTAPDDDAPGRDSEVEDINDVLFELDFETPDVDGPDIGDVDVAAVLAERDEYKAIAQRIQADFDNYRKRSSTQAAADAERATGRLAGALLPVLDAAEAAYLRHPDEVGPLLNQMLTELKKLGLETVDLDGQPFDPEVAEAVQHEAGDGGEPVVAEVLRSGYRWKGKTLRPAMVRTKD